MGLTTEQKYSMVRSVRRRALKTIERPANELVLGFRELVQHCAAKNRSAALIEEKKAFTFAVNRIESADYALTQEDISKDEHRKLYAEAIEKVREAIATMEHREKTLRGKVVASTESDPEISSDMLASAKTQIRSSKSFFGMDSLKEAFAEQSEKMQSVEKAKKAVVASHGIFDDETLAAQSVNVIARFEAERAPLVKKFAAHAMSKRIVFTASIMVRLENPLPDEVKHAKQRMHNIGSGFFIFERQTLVAYRDGYDNKALDDLRPMKEDYYFTEPSIPFKEIRWFVPAELYKFMRGIRFSAAAFPWTRRDGEGKKPSLAVDIGIPPHVQRACVESVLATLPAVMAEEAEFAKVQKEIGAHTIAINLLRDRIEKHNKEISALEMRKADASAVDRRLLDSQKKVVAKKVETLNEAVTKREEQRRMVKRTAALLQKRLESVKETSRTMLMHAARQMVASGKKYTDQSFQVGLQARAKKATS